jgi:TPR repeat protein
MNQLALLLRRLAAVAVAVVAVAATGGVASAQTEQNWKLPAAAPDGPAPTRAPPPTGLAAEAARFEFGEGIGRDYAMAADLYCRAARKGDADAAYRLGWMYANGRGMLRDDRIATGLFRYAAERSHEYAKRMLEHVNDAEAVLPDCMIPPAVIAAESRALPMQWTATPERVRIVDIVNRFAPSFGVEPRLALAIIQAESGFQVSAKSNKNAQGLMQLIPETAERFGVRKLMDPKENIRGGLAYLRWLLAYFEGDVTLVTAAYNAGEGAVVRYRGVPPYAETREYVARVTGVFGKTTHKFDPMVVDPSPMVVVKRMQRLSAVAPAR